MFIDWYEVTTHVAYKAGKENKSSMGNLDSLF